MSLLNKDFISNNDKDENQFVFLPVSSENLSLIMYAFSMVCYGVSNFHIKYINFYHIEDFELISFTMWRNLYFSIFIYVVIQYKSIKIIDIRNLNKNSQFWLGVRTIFQFLSLISLILCQQIFRVGTVNSFISMNPAVVIIFSAYLLKEKFYMRYALGILICFSGVLMLILNERSQTNQNKDAINGSIFMGVIYGMFCLISVALLYVASKILSTSNIEHENQCFYIAVCNFLLGFFCSIFFGKFAFSFPYQFSIIFNSFIYFLATYFNIKSLKGVDLIKTTSLNYISLVVATLSGIIFLGESLFITDVVGSFIILGYNMYNSIYPVESK